MTDSDNEDHPDSDAESDIGNEVGGLIEGIVSNVLSRADVSEAIRKGAQFHQRIAVLETGLTVGFYILTNSYAGAAFAVVSYVAGQKISSAAANLILEKGGFAARLELDPQQKNRHGRLLAGTFEPHSSVSILRIYDEEFYWGAERAQTMGELALGVVDLSQASSRSAVMISKIVDGRPYQRLGWFERDAIYKGTWEKENREGWGTLVYPGFGSYYGSWSGGSPRGFGELRYEDGGSYSGSISPGCGDRVLGVSVSDDGVIYAGEHRFPLYIFPDGTEVRNTRILPDGYGVRIADGRARRATWRAGKLETELKSKAEDEAEIFEGLVEEGHATGDYGVRAAKWRLKQAMQDSVWSELKRRLASSKTIFFYDRSI